MNGERIQMVDEIIVATIAKNSREEIRISTGTINGREIVSVRTWYEVSGGEMRPGKGGLAFRRELAGEIAAAIAKAGGAG